MTYLFPVVEGVVSNCVGVVEGSCFSMELTHLISLIELYLVYYINIHRGYYT